MGFLDNLDDPQKQAILAMGLGLLAGSGRTNKNFGADLAQAGLLGMQTYGQGKSMQAKMAEEAQQRQMRDMQMEQMKRQQADDQAIRGAYQRNVVPGMPQMQPTDYETPSGPRGPASMNMAGLRGDLQGAGPAGFAEYLKLASLDAPQVKEVAPGASLVNMRTNQPVYTAPERPPTGMVRNGAGALEYDPNYVEGQRKIREAGAPKTSVNLPPQEKAILKADEERLGELSTAASASRRIAQTSQVINGLLKGKGGGQLVKVGAETAKFLGLQSDTISANDLAESLNTQLATQIRAPGSGSTSNLEFEAYKAAAPSLKNSEQGRELMTQVALKFSARNAKLADKARELIRKGQYSDSALADYDDQLGSVLGDDLKKKLAMTTPARKSSDGWGELNIR
jgi:hypothetical protein